MAPKTANTPLPWRVVSRRTAATKTAVISVVGANGETVLAETADYDGTVYRDYRLIVDAVNAPRPKEGMSNTEKSIRRKLGAYMLAAVANMDDSVYDSLNVREEAWLARNGFDVMSVFDMQRIVAAGMKALYGIELKTLQERKKR